MDSASLASKGSLFLFESFFWKVLQTLMQVRTSSLKLVH